MKKRVILINALNLSYKNIKLFTFDVLKNYNSENSTLCLHYMYIFPSWLSGLSIGGGTTFYDDSNLNLVNDFDLPNLSRPWSRFIKDFLQLNQNIEKYPFNFEVEYSFSEIPLGFHQLKCFHFLSSATANFIDPSRLSGKSLKGIDQGIILKNLKNNSLLSNFELTDTIIKGCNEMSLELIFMAVQGAYPPRKSWEIGLTLLKKYFMV